MRKLHAPRVVAVIEIDVDDDYGRPVVDGNAWAAPQLPDDVLLFVPHTDNRERDQ